MSENMPVQEIVIVRRSGGGGDDGHHGGMWKIAFADFMTAMMAFFLVMWLINATDENKLQQIATYFNPIKLPDQQKSEKALQTADSHGGENQEATKERKAPKGQQNAGSGETEDKETGGKAGDEALFTDPYGILSKIATQVNKIPLPQGTRNDAAPQFSGGPAFRDPFDPDFRNRSPQSDAQLQRQTPDEQPDEDLLNETPAAPGQDVAGKASPDQRQKAEQPKDGKKTPQQQAADAGKQQQPPQSPGQDAASQKAGQGPSPSDKAGQGPAEAAQAPARQLETEIRQVLRSANLQDIPDLNVQRTSEGILISLTDKLNFEMFAVSSAQPRPELVVAMERIGKLLQQRSEKVVVRGHTDARPFRSGTYDNWRLSSDRANITHYMLVRGGLPEARFDRIEAYADTVLKQPSDPKGAANRRIEILLRQPNT